VARREARPPRIVQGHLEVVVMRCLEREPERRYSSAAALADELGRHLKGEPICDFEAG
jgi:eukaryotic-like serine/threonine-protein kinase